MVDRGAKYSNEISSGSYARASETAEHSPSEASLSNRVSEWTFASNCIDCSSRTTSRLGIADESF